MNFPKLVFSVLLVCAGCAHDATQAQTVKGNFTSVTKGRALTKTSEANGIQLSVTSTNESISTCFTNLSNDKVYVHGKVSLFRIKVLDTKGSEAGLSELGKQTFPIPPEAQQIDEENPGKEIYYSGWAESKPGVAAEKVYDLGQLFILNPGNYKISVHIVYSEDKKTQSILSVRDIPLTITK
jgi:hypothetical protein